MALILDMIAQIEVIIDHKLFTYSELQNVHTPVYYSYKISLPVQNQNLHTKNHKMQVMYNTKHKFIPLCILGKLKQMAFGMVGFTRTIIVKKNKGNC